MRFSPLFFPPLRTVANLVFILQTSSYSGVDREVGIIDQQLVESCFIDMVVGNPHFLYFVLYPLH